MKRADQGEQFAYAARALLGYPLITRDHGAYSEVARNSAALTAYFEETCGWTLHVDRRAGTARLHKRRSIPDATRGAVRPNGERMRAAGYATLMLVLAELISRPTTTVGDLADNLAAAYLADSSLPAFDPTVHAHRLRFVDALRWADEAGLIAVTAGDLARYQGGEGDAVVVADTNLIAQVLSTGTPPSRIRLATEAADVESWVAALCAEPRYRQAAEGVADTDATNRWARHMLGRVLLDDPVLDTSDLDPNIAAYLGSGAGRQWLRNRVAAAGLALEENADCLISVDETAEATDRTFGRNPDHAVQVAVAILDEFCPDRAPQDSPRAEVVAFVAALLEADTTWASKYPRDGVALADAALETLTAFGLARTDDTVVRPTPAVGRFVTTVIDSRTNSAASGPDQEEHP